MKDFENKYTSDWFESVREAQELVGLNNEDIRTTNEQWQQVSELAAEGDIDNKKMVDAVRAGLSEEQDAAVRSLLEVSKGVPYEEMVEFLNYHENRVAEARSALAAKALELSAEQARVYEQRDKLASIVPSMSDRLNAIAVSEASKLKPAGLKEAENRLVMAEAEMDIVMDLVQRTGEAWPVPSLVDVGYEPGEDEVVIVDQFPDERETDSIAIAEKIRRSFNSRLQDASVYLGVLLTEKPGHIWTPDELGKAIYQEDDTKRNKSRVAALISNYRAGKSPQLNEAFGEDLVLQRGKRRKYSLETGKAMADTVRVVWRAVDHETAQHAQVITTIDRGGETRQSYYDWESVVVDIVQEMEPIADEAVDLPPEPVDTIPPERKDPRESWLDTFTTDVHTTIERFKEMGLMDKPEISWKTINTKSDSTKMGTVTARERAFARKIIKRSDLAEDAVITVSQAILSDMVNGHQAIFSVGSRRRQAVAAVEKIVAGYFERKAAE